MGRDRKEASPEKAERSGDDDSKSRSRSRETPVSERKVRETSEPLRKKYDSSEDGKSRGKSERRRSRGSSDSEDTDDRKHGKRRRSRKRYSESESDDSSSEGSESGSESEYSESETETETEEERRRRKKKERRRREEERERKRRRKEKERKRRKEKEKEEDRKRRKKKDKKRKDRAEKGKTGAVTDSWGKYGIIRETDMWNKRPEFTAWLAEVKQVNLESLPNWEEKQMFKQFMEDHNTATFPSKKYYDLDTYHRREMEKEMKKGMKKVRAVERTVFNDEEQRRQELMVERERHKEEQLNALKREMQGGMAQAMKEQAQLKEEMQYQYKIGNMEAAAAIQRRLDPNLAM